MSIAFYMDVHIPMSITGGLRNLGVDVLRVQDDDSETLSDDELLDRATLLGRVIFSFDRDFMRETAIRQKAGLQFSGVVTAQKKKVTVQKCISDLHMISELCTYDELANLVTHLPL